MREDSVPGTIIADRDPTFSHTQAVVAFRLGDVKKMNDKSWQMSNTCEKMVDLSWYVLAYFSVQLSFYYVSTIDCWWSF